MKDYEPADVYPPGDTIAVELEARGWEPADLAEILGKTQPTISRLLHGKVSITPDMARDLAEAFKGTSAEFWLNLDAPYQLKFAKSTPGTNLRSYIYSKAPVREMVRRHWIEPSNDPEVLQERVCKFLGVASLEEEPRPFHAIAARKATSYAETSPSQAAWLCRVRQIATAAPVTGRYDSTRFHELVHALKALVPSEPELRRVARILSDFGVRFLIVEALPGSKIDGVCVWLNDRSPVIVLSLRYGRVDSFWFTLFHELAHMKAGDGLKAAPPIDTELVEGKNDLPPMEAAATKFALETLINPRDLDSFIARVGPAYTLRNIGNFAARIGTHTALVIGQLAHNSRGEITWGRFGSSLGNIRSIVTSSALTDGWGHVVMPAG